MVVIWWPVKGHHEYTLKCVTILACQCFLLQWHETVSFQLSYIAVLSYFTIPQQIVLKQLKWKQPFTLQQKHKYRLQGQNRVSPTRIMALLLLAWWSTTPTMVLQYAFDFIYYTLPRICQDVFNKKRYVWLLAASSTWFHTYGSPCIWTRFNLSNAEP